jgi:hypothetical protein
LAQAASGRPGSHSNTVSHGFRHDTSPPASAQNPSGSAAAALRMLPIFGLMISIAVTPSSTARIRETAALCCHLGGRLRVGARDR